jgi:hypothetical protein
MIVEHNSEFREKFIAKLVSSYGRDKTYTFVCVQRHIAIDLLEEFKHWPEAEERAQDAYEFWDDCKAILDIDY